MVWPDICHHGVAWYLSSWCGLIFATVVWPDICHHGVAWYLSPWCGLIFVTMVWSDTCHHGVAWYLSPWCGLILVTMVLLGWWPESDKICLYSETGPLSGLIVHWYSGVRWIVNLPWWTRTLPWKTWKQQQQWLNLSLDLDIKAKGTRTLIFPTVDHLLLLVTGLQESHKCLEDRLSKVEKCSSDLQRVNDDKQTRSVNSRTSDLGGKDTQFADNSRGRNVKVMINIMMCRTTSMAMM